MIERRLYLEQPLLQRFTARVVEQSTFEHRPSVVLDRTAFCPEGGGQRADHGTLDGQPVLDVQSDAQGRIHHVLQQPLPKGQQVRGELELGFRRQQMAQHTGQHMLSAAVLRCLGARTRHARLGAGVCTIDVEPAGLTLEALAPAEQLVNEVINQDRPVRAWFPDEQELGELEFRRRPKVQREIRVVQVEGLDLVPCGGTHCQSTAQVGLLLLLGAERYKGLTRISFQAGSNARELALQHRALLHQAAAALACSPELVPALARQRVEELDIAAQERHGLRRQLTERLVAELGARLQDDRLVAELSSELEQRLVLEAAKGITRAHPGAVVVLGRADEHGLFVTCLRGKQSAFNCGAFFGRLRRALPGSKGGGGPEHAQGRLTPAAEQWQEVVNRCWNES